MDKMRSRRERGRENRAIQKDRERDVDDTIDGKEMLVWVRQYLRRSKKWKVNSAERGRVPLGASIQLRPW